MEKKQIIKTTDENFHMKNVSQEEFHMVNQLYSHIQDKSPSDAAIDLTIHENGTNFSGHVRINSAQTSIEIEKNNIHSLEEFVSECQDEFNNQISSWQKERTL